MGGRAPALGGELLIPPLLELTLETARLVMRPVHPDFAPAIFAEFTPEICRHMFPQPPRRIGDTLDYIAGARAAMGAGEELAVSLFHRSSGDFLGGAGMHRLKSDAPEVGIWIKLSAHGQGYGLEAVAGLVRWTFATAAPRHVIYPVMVENWRSRRIPERLGGTLTRRFQKANAAGVMRDLAEYAIVDGAGRAPA